MKTKKGTIGSESVLWIYRLIILVIIIGAIVSIVWFYFSQHHDIRPIEASILYYKIDDCLEKKGIIDIKKINKDYLSECLSIPKETRDFFIRISADVKNKNIANTSFGKSGLKVLCESKRKGVKGKYLPYCFNVFQYSLIKDKNENKKAKVNFFIAIDKSLKNV